MYEMPGPFEYKLIRRATARALERHLVEELRGGWERVGDVIAWSEHEAGRRRSDYTQLIAKPVVQQDASPNSAA
jgi:hypothetical protein